MASAESFHHASTGNLERQITDEEDASPQAKDAVAETQRAAHAERGVSEIGPVDIVDDVQHEKKWKKPNANKTANVGSMNVDGGVGRRRGQSVPLTWNGERV